MNRSSKLTASILKTKSMTTAIQNRNDAFFNNQVKLNGRKKTVYNLIKTYKGLTSFEIKDKMRLEKHAISGRITELSGMFLVKPNGSKRSPKSNEKSTIWVVTEHNERFDLINDEYVKLRDKKDCLLSDYLMGLSAFTKSLLKKEMRKIDIKIKGLENILDALKVEVV